MTLSEAVEKVYAIQKEYAGYSGIDKKWVEVQLKSYEAIGLIKFKKETSKEPYYKTVSQTMKGNTVRTVYVTYALINHVAQKLREKCLVVFGNSWSNDIAMQFARTAITEYEFQRTHDEKSVRINFPD